MSLAGIAPLARLAARAYGLAVRARNRRYDRPGSSLSAAVPVVSVGNLTVGGTGKTPLVALLAREILGWGHRPAIVSRGYRGTAGSGPLVVSEGRGALVGPERSGDEPVLLARLLPGALVVVGSDRVLGAREAARLGADIVLLDDGFQHRRLRRDLDVVLLDRGDPFGGGLLLPAGRLREPPDSLSRADVVVVTRCAPDDDAPEVAESVRRVAPRVPVVRSGHRTVGFVDRRGAPVPAPRQAIAFCAVGNPGSFRRDLSATGVEVLQFVAFRDHHPFRPGDLDPLARRSLESGAVLVTTEKDLVRLARSDAPDPGPVVALRIDAVLHEPDPILGPLRSLLEAP